MVTYKKENAIKNLNHTSKFYHGDQDIFKIFFFYFKQPTGEKIHFDVLLFI